MVPSSNPSAVSIASTDRVDDLTALITSSASHTSNYLLFPHSTSSAWTSTASATPADNPSHGRLSAGAYAGIVIGVVPAIFVFLFFLHRCLKLKRRERLVKEKIIRTRGWQDIAREAYRPAISGPLITPAFYSTMVFGSELL